jgi:hypothetical protein
MNTERVIIAALVVGLTASAVKAQGDSSSTTSAPKPTKSGNVVGRDAKAVGSDIEKGSKGLARDIGKGVKGMGHELKKGAGFFGSESKKAAKETEKGADYVGSETKKGVEKVTPHKKSKSASQSQPSTEGAPDTTK